jgi:hypothetical protein
MFLVVVVPECRGSGFVHALIQALEVRNIALVNRALNLASGPSTRRGR